MCQKLRNNIEDFNTMLAELTRYRSCRKGEKTHKKSSRATAKRQTRVACHLFIVDLLAFLFVSQHFAYMWILWQQKQRKKHRKSTTCNAGNLLGPKFRQGKLYCK